MQPMQHLFHFRFSYFQAPRYWSIFKSIFYQFECFHLIGISSIWKLCVLIYKCPGLIKDRGGGQNFSTSFCMRFNQAPLCRYRFKVIFDNIIFLLSGNIIEYIYFWRFNSIIMTWNKWLGFTKSVIMGLNNISPWPCPPWRCLFTVRNYRTLFNTITLHAGRWCSGMSLASHGVRRWFKTHTILCGICYFLLLTLFCTFCSLFHKMTNISIFLSHWYSHINFYFPFSQFMCRRKDWNACKIGDIHFSYFKLLFLAKDHWRGFSTRNAHMVHIINSIRFKMV